MDDTHDAHSSHVQEALDGAPCGLLRTGAQGRIVQVNATFCSWLGYDRQSLLGRRLQDLLTVGGRIFQQTHLAPLMQMQGSVSEVKLDFVHRDGGSIPMVLNAQRRETPEGLVTDIAVFVARDRDKYERELVLARQRLEQMVSEAKAHQESAKQSALFAEQMMGIVSHDLRNPLSTIHMGAQLLARTETRPHQLSVLARISRATDRAHRLINDLLDFTQARLGKGLAVAPKPFSPHALVAEVVDELGQAFPGRAMLHERAGEGDCVADPDRVGQLVGNLVGNAIAYGTADAPITVRSEVHAQHFVISVHNAGMPIPLDAQATLFQPLVRGTEAGATRSVGLGLFIVSEIAKAHGGHVAVSSGAGTGTLFIARFPRATDSAG